MGIGPSSGGEPTVPWNASPSGPGSAEPGSGGKVPPRAAGRTLKGRALQWLSQREHSRSELRRKLMPHARAEDLARTTAGSAAKGAAEPAHGEVETDANVPDAAVRVEAVLDWLEAHRYLSNERFVESRVHVRSERYGNLRIRQELKQHQLTLTPEAARQLRDSEFDRAEAVRLRKFGDLPATPVERARQARFLGARGFSPEVVGRVLRSRGSRPDEVD